MPLSQLVDLMVAWLIDLTFKATVLLVAAWIAASLLARASAAIRHRVWSLTMLSLVLLPALSWCLPAWKLPVLPSQIDVPVARVEIEPIETATEIAPVAEFEDSTPAPANQTDPVEFVPLAPENVANEVAVSDQPAPAGPPVFGLSLFLVGSWIVGVLACAVGIGLGCWRVQALSRTSTRVGDRDWSSLIESLRGRLGLRKNVELRESFEPIVPLTWGLWRPTILLPPQAKTWADAMRRAVLLHELAHVQRADVAYQLLGRLACAMYWFHPLAWLALRQMRQEREQACDDAVLHTGEQASTYAEQLLEVARLYCRPRGMMLAVEMARSSQLEQRLRAMFDSARSHAPLNRRWGLGVLMLTGLLLCTVAIVQPVARQAEVSADERAIEQQEEVERRRDDTRKRLKGREKSSQTDKPANDAKVAAAEPKAAPAAKASDEAANSDTEPITITGIATANGKPVPNAKIYLLSIHRDFRRVAEVKTDQAGRYEFRDAPLPIERAEKNTQGRDHGAFEILGVAPGHGFAWRPRKIYFDSQKSVNIIDDVDAPSTFNKDDKIELNLEFGQSAVLRGRIGDEQGQPVAGVKLQLRYCARIHEPRVAQGVVSSGDIYELTAMNQTADVPTEVKVRETNAQGEFEFTDLPEECLFRMDVRHKDYATMSVWAATTDRDLPQLGGTTPIWTDDVILTFQKIYETKVRVVFGDTGQPAKQAFISGELPSIHDWKLTDEDGYAVLRLPVGEYPVYMLPAKGTNYLDSRETDRLTVTSNPSEEPVVFQLKPACVLDISIVNDETGEGIPEADLWSQQPGGDFAFRAFQHPNISLVERPVSDKDGKLKALAPPGKLRLGVGNKKFPPGYKPDATGQEIDCVAGKTIQVEFRLQRAPKKDGAKVKPAEQPPQPNKRRDAKGDLRSENRRGQETRAEQDEQAALQKPAVEPKKDSAATTKSPPTIPVYIVLAEHVMLWEGQEIVTWDDIEKRMAAFPDPSLLMPQFYATRAGEDGDKGQRAQQQMARLRDRFKYGGYGIGGLWPPCHPRYDRIRTPEDLKPNEADRVEGRVLNPDGKPVADAEVVLITPIPKGSHHESHTMYVQQGHVRNSLEEVMARTDREGRFHLYPPPDQEFSIVAMSPETGFGYAAKEYFLKEHEIKLHAWAGLECSLEGNPKGQTLSLSTRLQQGAGLPDIYFKLYAQDQPPKADNEPFRFLHVPYYSTSISRGIFQNPDGGGGTFSVPEATVELSPGEIRRITFGPLTAQQQERIDSIRRMQDERLKGKEKSSQTD